MKEDIQVDEHYREVAGVLTDEQKKKGMLIHAFQEIQKQYNYLPEDKLKELSRNLGIPLSEIYSEMVVLMGLATGIDYSLFIITRYRGERDAARTSAPFGRVNAGASSEVAAIVFMEFIAGPSEASPRLTRPDAA